MSHPLESAVHLLAKAEAEILLLARGHPTNWEALKAQLCAGWARGERCEPNLEFNRAPDLRAVHALLGCASGLAAGEGPLGEHLVKRAGELDEEASLAEQIGKPCFRACAAHRYGHRGTEMDVQADALAASWCSSNRVWESEVRIPSDDFSNPLSLVNQVRGEMERQGITMPMRVDRRLAAVATVDRECVWVRAGELLRPGEATRIAVHEIRGHAVRRVAARRPENFMSSAGFLSSDEDEEGRAIWLEEQAGWLDAARRGELASRHLAADACQRGATFVDTVELLSSVGTSINEALTIALRVWRGGGLAREVVYLRAYVRVRRVLSDAQQVEQWMARGRFSIEVAAQVAKGELVWPSASRSGVL